MIPKGTAASHPTPPGKGEEQREREKQDRGLEEGHKQAEMPGRHKGAAGGQAEKPLSRQHARLAGVTLKGPTQLWNAMIHPLLPMRFAGAVWYQGEANAGNPPSYACRFPAMITDWRCAKARPSAGPPA